MSIDLKKGDTIKVMAGKDRSKTGKVVGVDRKSGLLTVEGVNIRTRFERSKRQNQKGQKVQFPAPFNPSKVMLVCPNCGQITRIGHVIASSGKKLRACKKCKSSF
ncbi:MAG: 50S ribosomal protein L24 [Candidatus Doudnabacteria bacterium RIFCSPHIGHO2_01_FULL_50_11]|uniref:Large ribosomal subunit protein uL24 n=1 Tax=Candidatus Doudnabacteria bacterium RIFCSPHIGHO2_01_FULL_50_11 TaxID=1817828 RepID=A0A1F5PN21_9BACT|nr:MAG: 50S ribosomal protein L24 [Candidatus Doudnabacteria bacterium RIFCSPHIGHO2_01_FULL_50_11]